MEGLTGLVESGKNGLTRLIEKIPGIGGYEKKESRRETDKIVREAVASRFEAHWGRISMLQREVLKTGGIVYVGDLEGAAIKTRQFIDRVKTASYGYAGLFDAVKADDIALQQLYDYDLYLFKLSDSMETAIDDVEKAINANEGIPQAIKQLTSIAADCVEAFNRRKEVITGTQNA